MLIKTNGNLVYHKLVIKKLSHKRKQFLPDISIQKTERLVSIEFIAGVRNMTFKEKETFENVVSPAEYIFSPSYVFVKNSYSILQ